MVVAARVLGPSVEGRTRATVQSHDARFAGSVFLIRIDPTDAVDLALFVVHAFDEGPDGVSRKSRSLTLVDVRKYQMRIIKTDPWRVLKQLHSLRTQRRLVIKRDLFALDLHALSGDDMQPVALIVLLNLAQVASRAVVFRAAVRMAKARQRAV